MQGEQFPADGQSETAAAESAPDRGVRLLEGLAQRSQGDRIDAYAGIRHDQSDCFSGIFDVQRDNSSIAG